MTRQITHGTLGPQVMTAAELINALSLMILSVVRGSDTGRIAYHLSEEGPPGSYEVDGHWRSGSAEVPNTVIGIPITREG